MIFETKRFIIRTLAEDDIQGFHAMQGDPKVMTYTTGKANTLERDRIELVDVIEKYAQPNNDFWVWAIEKKDDRAFIGTVALIVNDDGQNEIGYRLVRKYWGQGFGTEICRGLILQAVRMKLVPLYAYVDTRNIASIRILESTGFRFLEEAMNKELNCVDRIYVYQK